ncbi:hypothetical protein ACFVDU_12750 [Streptomyces albidoflavus]
MSTSTKKTQTRFLRRGISKILWVKDLNDPKYPSRTEITKAFVLTAAVSDIEGWALENDPIETPDMGRTFNSSIPGSDKAENSSLTFYEDRFSDAIEQQLPKGAEGYVVLLRKGDLPGKPQRGRVPCTGRHPGGHVQHRERGRQVPGDVHDHRRAVARPPRASGAAPPAAGRSVRAGPGPRPPPRQPRR